MWNWGVMAMLCPEMFLFNFFFFFLLITASDSCFCVCLCFCTTFVLVTNQIHSLLSVHHVVPDFLVCDLNIVKWQWLNWLLEIIQDITHHKILSYKYKLFINNIIISPKIPSHVKHNDQNKWCLKHLFCVSGTFSNNAKAIKMHTEHWCSSHNFTS